LKPQKPHLSISCWAEEDRPREKLILKGKSALSDAELIAILIGSGTKEISAVDLGRSILSEVNGDLNQLSKLTIQDLTRFKGIGTAKAVTIAGALELGRRRKEMSPAHRTKIESSRDVFELMKPELIDKGHEEFWIVLLNRANYVLKKQTISSGGISGTVADPKLIFKIALDHLASAIILVHNHPSGNLQPSEADIRLTHKLRKSGELLEIAILDHIIFTDHNFLSFADENLL
jgi:DNA repair protein RadC